jgi:lysozyme
MNVINLSEARERVIKAIYGELQLLENNKLDDLARELMGLPARPVDDLPFIGWLMPVKSVTERTSHGAEATSAPVSSQKTTSLTGIQLIKEWEGWRDKAYLCPAGKWTIGYGHTKTAKRGMVISKENGEKLLREDLQVYENAVNRLVTVPLNQNQFDALVSFTYNVGRGAFSQSTLLRYLNNGHYDAAANQFTKWVNGGGKELPGLVARRETERTLFLL